MIEFGRVSPEAHEVQGPRETLGESMPELNGDHGGPNEGVAPCRPCYPVFGDPYYYDFGYLEYYGCNSAADEEVVPDLIDDIPDESLECDSWVGLTDEPEVENGEDLDG